MRKMPGAANYPLTIELTPPFMSSWALRKHISEYKWQEIRRNLLIARGLTCEICKTTVERRDELDAHEVFIFPEDGTVRLDRIQLLCKLCHAVKDFAHTERLFGGNANNFAKYRKKLIDKFCKENKCNDSAFEDHYREAQRKARDLQMRYGANIPEQSVHYGDYHGYYISAKDPERFNSYTAATHAIADAIHNGGVHDDYREDLIEITKSDPQLAEKILRLVKGEDYKSTRALMVEVLSELFEDDTDIIRDDEPTPLL